MIQELHEKKLPETCYVFKHSTRCPISSRAAEVVKGSEDVLPHTLYWINVVEQRELSNWVAEEYGAQHQSPQLLLIREGKVAGNWTHGAIKADIFQES
jgi:bacillithiol system protein YtxJ